MRERGLSLAAARTHDALFLHPLLSRPRQYAKLPPAGARPQKCSTAALMARPVGSLATWLSVKGGAGSVGKERGLPGELETPSTWPALWARAAARATRQRRGAGTRAPVLAGLGFSLGLSAGCHIRSACGAHLLMPAAASSSRTCASRAPSDPPCPRRPRRRRCRACAWGCCCCCARAYGCAARHLQRAGPEVGQLRRRRRRRSWVRAAAASATAARRMAAAAPRPQRWVVAARAAAVTAQQRLVAMRRGPDTVHSRV